MKFIIKDINTSEAATEIMEKALEVTKILILLSNENDEAKRIKQKTNEPSFTRQSVVFSVRSSYFTENLPR